MKRTLIVTVAMQVLCASALIAGEPMSAADRDRLIGKLEASKDALMRSIEGLDQPQWDYKPDPERWSVAECLEHIAATEGFILNLMSDFMATQTPAQNLTDDLRKDEIVTSVITDRTSKLKAPDPLQPTNRFGDHEGSLAEFHRVRSATIVLVRDTKDLRSYAGDHPVFGQMDALGWVLFLSGHSERHTAQIEEVKAHPLFPK